MTLGLVRERLLAVMMVLAILVVGMPVSPAAARIDCGQAAMTMPMDMPSAPQKMPGKSGFPCSDGLNCLGAAGCAFPSVDQAVTAYLRHVGVAYANWTSRLAGPAIAYKPALPPPIA